MTGIYKITNPKGKIYIGSSKNIKKRFNRYKKLDCKSQTKIYNSLNKYGINEHIFEIIYTCDVSELYKWERYFGEQYDVLGENGLNLKLPNTEDKPAIYSEESKEKMSLNRKGMISPMKGKNLSEYSKSKISFANKGKLSPMKGKKMSKESREKMSYSKKGKPSNHSTKIMDTNTGKIYNSITQLAKELGKDRYRLAQHLSGEVKINKYPNFIKLT